MSVPFAGGTTTPSSLTDRVVDFQYGDDGRLLSQTTYASFGPAPDAIPSTTSFGYDPLGRPETETDALGNVHEKHYDAATGRLDTLTANDGLQSTLGSRITTLHYDSVGRVQLEVEGEGGADPITTNYAYDGLDRMRSGSRWIEGDDYFTAEYGFDLLGRLRTVTEAPGGGAERITARAYDRLGRLKSITGYDADPGTSTTHAQTTTYDYDRQGRRLHASYPGLTGGSGQTQNAYDRLGRIVQGWDLQNRASLYFYDKRGLLLTRALCSSNLCGGGNDSPVDVFVYDGLGRIKSARRDTRVSGGALTTQSTVSFGYDAFSNLISDTQDLRNAVALSQSFVYDQIGNRVQSNCPSQSNPFLPCLENYFDQAERLLFLFRNGTELADYNFTNGSFGEHLESRVVYTSGFDKTLESHSTYDTYRRETYTENRRKFGAAPTLLTSFDPAFDGLGNRTVNVVGGDPALSEQSDFMYSQLQQLRSSDHTGGRFDGAEVFLTDRLGNRNSVLDTRPAVDVSTAYGANNDANGYSWIGTSSATVQYDPSGNLTRDEEGRTFVYDLEDHLVEVKDSAGKSLSKYAYDALGRRVSQTRDFKTTYFYYDGDRVVAEYEGSGVTAVPRRYFVDGPMYVDEHLLMHERELSPSGTWNEADFYYVQGPLYSVSALTDVGGNVVETYRYDSFGGLSFTPKVDAVGGRYLRITLPDGDSGPNNEKKVRIRVRPDCPGSTWKYAGPPALNRLSNAGWAKLVDDVAQAGETVAGGPNGLGGWGPVVYVTGGDIVPERSYVVEVEHRLNGVTVATQMARTAVPTGKWGDADGNGIVNFSDASRIVAVFQGTPPFGQDNTARYAADLKGAGCAGNGVVNFEDVSAAVGAFQGTPYYYNAIFSANSRCVGCAR